MPVFEKFSSKLEELISRFAVTTAVTALKNGVLATLPLTLLGSIFLLLASFPITGWSDIMTGILGENWKYPFTQISSNTFDIIAIVSAMSIGYQYAKLKNVEPFACGLMSLVNFLVFIPPYEKSGDIVVNSVIAKTWSGGNGMVTAIVVALISSWIYTAIVEKGWKIKMPDGVPEGVINAFTALIPGLITLILSFTVCALLKFISNITLAELLLQILQIPLQGTLSSLGGFMVLTFMISICWMFGIHSTVVNSIANPILRANSLANQALIDAGVKLTAENGAYLVTFQSRSNFITMTGACITIGLILAMVFKAKSKQYKELGKMALVPACFNITEPILFGFPIVFNFGMIIPVVLVPICASLTVYFAHATGMVVPFGAIEVPWTTPPIISGFILGGWRAALLQIVIIIESCIGYFPFFLREDRKAYKKEIRETTVNVSI